jgi:4'-phosphopantetheinyl transferase
MTLAEAFGDVRADSFEHSPDLIRVWWVKLGAFAGEEALLEAILSVDESDKARGYHFDRDRRRFTVARAILRILLGRYLQTRPEVVAFEYGPHGKPSLAGRNQGIRFNVSHSQDVALIAVAHDREVGVDIECLRPITDQEQLVASNFSSREMTTYLNLPASQRQAAFFAAWTRKEAYLKARGDGLSLPLNSFSVSLGPDESAALLEVPSDPLELTRWRMANLSLASGYAGALVAAGEGWSIDYVN